MRTPRITPTLLALSLAVLAAQPVLAQKKGGTLTIATEAEFSGFDHLKAKIFNQNTSAPASTVMETLFAYEGKTIVPRLGLSLAEAPDRLSATVKLRQGVKFHDGTPFNADAVVFHYMRLLDPKSGVNVGMISSIEAVEKVDEHTVRFKLKAPWSALRSALALEGLINFIGSPTALKDQEAFHRHPVGTGPFVFKEWRAGDRVVMERNPNYWDRKLPYLDRVIYRVLPDGNTRFASMKSGEVDIGRMDVAEHVLAAQEDKSLVVHSYQGAGAYMWNFQNKRPPFDDARVRQAVTHAFNAQAMIDTMYRGTTTATNDLMGPKSEWHCPNLNWRKYDLAKARALVAQYGKPIEFELVSTNTPAGRRQAAMVQQFVQQAGMKATIKLVEQSQNVRVGLSGDFQMDVWRYSDIAMDPDMILTYYFGGTSGEPVSRHDTGKIDPLLAKARSESDPRKRKQIYCEAMQLFADEAWSLIPIRTTYFAIAQPHVKGLPEMQNSLIRVRAMWVDKK